MNLPNNYTIMKLVCRLIKTSTNIYSDELVGENGKENVFALVQLSAVLLCLGGLVVGGGVGLTTSHSCISGISIAVRTRMTSTC